MGGRGRESPTNTENGKETPEGERAGEGENAKEEEKEGEGEESSWCHIIPTTNELKGVQTSYRPSGPNDSNKL